MRNIMIAVTVVLCALLTAISGFALTPQQVMDLKKAGVSDQTIQTMLKQEEAKDAHAAMGKREVHDKDGNTSIIYTTGNVGNSVADDEEKKNVDRAWEMLNNIIIDKRHNK